MTDYICLMNKEHYGRCAFVPEEKVNGNIDGFVNYGSYIPKDALEIINRQRIENPEFNGIIYVGNHYSVSGYYDAMKELSNKFNMPVASRICASWHSIPPETTNWKQEPSIFQPNQETLDMSDKFIHARKNYKQKVVQDYETAIISEQFETKDKFLLFNLKKSKNYNLLAEAAVLLGKTLQIEMKQNNTEQLTEKILNTARAKMIDLNGQYSDFIARNNAYANVLSILSATSKYGDQIDRFRDENSRSCDPYIQQYSQTGKTSKNLHIIE